MLTYLFRKTILKPYSEEKKLFSISSLYFPPNIVLNKGKIVIDSNLTQLRT